VSGLCLDRAWQNKQNKQNKQTNKHSNKQTQSSGLSTGGQT
jgi:hypothetical protein